MTRARAPRQSGVPRELGGLVREHRARRDAIPTAAAAFALALIGAIASGAVGFYRWYFAYSQFGPAVVWRWAAPAWWAAVGFLALSWYFLYRAWNIGRRVVRVYAGGLAVVDGKRGRAFQWAEIDKVYAGGMRYGVLGRVWRDRAWLDLITSRGERIHLGFPLADLDTLAHTVKQSVFPRLLAEARRTFNAGGDVAFGSLTVDRVGLHVGQRSIPWSSVRSASIDAGRMVVDIESRGRPQRLRLRAAVIPNADLCLQIIQLLGLAQ